MPRRIAGKRLLMMIIGILAIVLFTASYFVPLLLGLKGGGEETETTLDCSWIIPGKAVTNVPGIPGFEVYVNTIPRENETSLMVINLVNRKNEALTLTFHHDPVVSVSAIDLTGAQARIVVAKPSNTTIKTLAPLQALQLSLLVPSSKEVAGYLIDLPDYKIRLLVWNTMPNDAVCGMKNLDFDGGVLSIRWALLYQGLVAIDPIIVSTTPILSINIPANTTIYEATIYDENGEAVFIAKKEGSTHNVKITLYAGGATSGILSLGPEVSSLLGEPSVLEFITRIQLPGLGATRYIETLPAWTNKWPGKWVYYSDTTIINDNLTYIASLSYNGYYIVVNSSIINNSQKRYNITGQLVFSSSGVRAAWFNASVIDVAGNVISAYPADVIQSLPLILHLDPYKSYSTTVVLSAPYLEAKSLEINVANKKIIIDFSKLVPGS